MGVGMKKHPEAWQRAFSPFKPLTFIFWNVQNIFSPWCKLSQGPQSTCPLSAKWLQGVVILVAW